MAFHCEKCGTTLSGEYDSCPVCAKIEEVMRSIDGGEMNLANKWASMKLEEEKAPETGAETLQDLLDEEEPFFAFAEDFERAQDALEQEKAAETAEEAVPAEETVPAEEEETPEEDLAEVDWSLPEDDVETVPEETAPAAEEKAEPEEIISALSEETGDAVEIEKVLEEVPEHGLTTEIPAIVEVEAVTVHDLVIPPEALGKEESAEETAEIPEEEETDEEPVFHIPEKRDGILEQQLMEKAEKAGVKPKKSGGGPIFAIVLVIMTILLALATAKFVVVPLIEKKAADAAAASYFDYINGTWVSEYFAFNDRPSECCVEVLTIHEDGSFEMSYYLPDNQTKDGWKDGSWEESFRVSGEAKIVADKQQLMLVYEKEEVSYYYDRYFVSMDEGEMYLREYYDDSHTSYYDVCFTKQDIQ